MTTDGGYRRVRQVVSALHAHLAFVTKYQRDVLTGERALGNRLVGILHGCLASHAPYDEATA
jgi:REP element-mobilizing transposase RayT